MDKKLIDISHFEKFDAGTLTNDDFKGIGNYRYATNILKTIRWAKLF